MTPPAQKENFPSKIHHASRTQDSKLPISRAKDASAPLKPILENAPTTTSPCMPPAPKPSADSPLACVSYLSSPAETLLESMGANSDDVSLHDLIEAYNTLSNRIRSQIRVILTAETPTPALVSLEVHAHQIGEALCRDLKRTRDEPPHSCQTSFAGAPFQMTSETDAVGLRVSRDLALLSNHVLCFISDIFSFPPLYAIFTTNDLRSIFSELLALGLAPVIPNPTSQRTWTLVVWILSVQNLPSAVLLPAQRQIVSVLRRALEGQIGKDQAKSDGLKATSHLLKQCPSLFISPLLEVFPSILRHLTADSCAIRLQAVKALGRFAMAATNTSTTTSGCHASISALLTTYINSQCKSARRLRTLVTAAVSSDKPSYGADSPFWAVQLLASFVILLDGAIFLTPHALKLTGRSLQRLAAHNQRLASALHAYLWKCLVWVFSRLPKVAGDVKRDAIFLTVKQDLRGGIGLALVLALLDAAPNDGSCDTSDSVTKVLLVVGDMLSNQDELLQVDGIAILTKLLYTPALSSLPDSQNLDILVPQLFDGSLLQAKHSQVSSVVRSLGQPSVSGVRQLSDSEILRHWNGLADLWVRATNISLRPEFARLRLDPPRLSAADYRQNLLCGWQSLLLMPTDLTQCYAHLTMPEPFADRFVTLICSFLKPADTPDAQNEYLLLVSKMWRIATNVFQSNWLSAPAETVLGAVLKQSYNLSDERIREAWAELCSQLISKGLPSAVAAVRDQMEGKMALEVQRQLWALAVKSIHKSDTPPPWMDLANLLSIPCRAWKMSDAEVELWDALLYTAITAANADAIRPTIVVEHVFELVGDSHIFLDSPKELSTLLLHVDLSGKDALPDGIIRIADKVLGELYSQQAMIPTSLSIIRRLRDITLSTPPTLALPLLLALQGSICTWLEDEDNVLIGDVRKEISECLFSTPLSTIQDLEPSGPNLISISRFLGTLADADAFERFWRVTYHRRDEFYDLYPESIKTCLRALSDTFGGSFAAGISVGGTSQCESLNVPDSQPSQAASSSSFDSYADASRYVFDADTIGMGDTRSLEIQQSGASTVRGNEVQIRPVASAALDRLQEYSSHLDDTSMLDVSFHESGSVPLHSSATVQHNNASHPRLSNTSASSKRRSDVQDAPADKRRKPNPIPCSERVRHNAIAGPSRIPGQSVSEPVSRRDSVIVSEHPSSYPTQSPKQMGKRRLILDYIEVPTFEECRRLRQETSLPTPSPSLRPQPRPVEEEEEDYASWEASLSLSQVKHIQHTFGCDTQDSSSDEGESSLNNMDLTEDPSSDDRPLSPSLGASSRRSHTVPVPPRDRPPPLRRNTTSAQLDALERAYAAVSNDASQIAPHDLVHATRLVHKIGAALNEQMSRKLDKPR
ncbi:hypothetical protein B0H15DRAFT_880339 [Mycena belliarum]|uniref:Telomere-associated protein Rif1 N-terminal domain-containing protein n=1 Tax=Mycena belliarum TaxID=1033014 RepID=A0AAD6UEL3_9AGAR|nr:hypothetical protein B0H15DRAFT_880339 [Mycena belliae]